MAMSTSGTLITPKVLDALYTEAMVLADEARSYFESGRFHEQCSGDPEVSVAFSCESLKVTTRLMHCIAWLLNQRALHGDELTEGEVWNHDRALGYAASSDAEMARFFPEEARQIVMASEELFFRLQRLSSKMDSIADPEPEVHNLFRRLQTSF